MIFADFIILGTVVSIFASGIVNINKEGSKLQQEQLINPVTWHEAMGFSVFLFEGIGVILPIEDATANKA